MRRTIETVAFWAVVFLGFGLFLFMKEYHMYYRGYRGESKKIRIERGSSARDVAVLLEREGIIKHKTTFLIFHRLFFKGAPLQAGVYRFCRPLRTVDVIRKLVKGEIATFRVSVPEGLTVEETAEVFSPYLYPPAFMEAAGNWWLIKDLDPEARDLEGYLFPDTYVFPEDVLPSLVVKRMVQNFKRKFTPELKARAKEMGMSIREVVTLASIIEKESSNDEEKPLISSVFHNRLKLGMPLQSDPTIIYAMKKMGIWKGRLYRKHYRQVKSPYNTYLHRGLPPGPICNPGLSSIKAALYPAKTDYLYFIAVGGKHEFSRTYQQHLQILRSRR